MDPFLKSVGGKSWLASKLVPEIMRLNPWLYVEPFVGGGAVALTLPPRLAKTVSDLNPAFAAVWNAIKYRQPETIATELERTARRFPETAFGYVQARDELNVHLGSATDPLDRGELGLQFAALALHVNHRSFNGLWRVNKSGLFNVPWGKYKTVRRHTLAELQIFHQLLGSVGVGCRDFRSLLDDLLHVPKQHGPIVVYADPPYDSIPDDKSRRAFCGYTAAGFDETDQRHLAAWLKYISDRGIHVFATNADTPLVREIYSWAKIEEIVEWHSVGSTAKRRGERSCLLIRG